MLDGPRPQGSPSIGVYRVVRRHNTETTAVARAEDFESQLEAIVEDCSGIATWGSYLPYCVNFAERHLVLARPRQGGFDLEAPFLYYTQRLTAHSLVRVPFEKIHQLDQGERMSPTFILTPGRSGSTLLMSLLRTAGAATVSEPDVFTNVARHITGAAEDVSREYALPLLRVCVAAFRNDLGSSPFIKLRGSCNAIVDEFTRAFPQACFVFILRNRETWAESLVRAFGLNVGKMVQTLAECVTAIDRLRSRGARIVVLWYEDLLSSPVETVRNICTVHIGAEQEQRFAETMSRDAQAGTPLARSRLPAAGMTREQAFSFEAAWRQHPVVDDLARNGLERLR